MKTVLISGSSSDLLAPPPSTPILLVIDDPQEPLPRQPINRPAHQRWMLPYMGVRTTSEGNGVMSKSYFCVSIRLSIWNSITFCSVVEHSIWGGTSHNLYLSHKTESGLGAVDGVVGILDQRQSFLYKVSRNKEPSELITISVINVSNKGTKTYNKHQTKSIIIQSSEASDWSSPSLSKSFTRIAQSIDKITSYTVLSGCWE